MSDGLKAPGGDFNPVSMAHPCLELRGDTVPKHVHFRYIYQSFPELAPVTAGNHAAPETVRD